MGHFVNPYPSPIWRFCQSTPHPNPSHNYPSLGKGALPVLPDHPGPHLALLPDPLWPCFTGSNGPPWPHLVSLPDLLGACFTVSQWNPLIFCQTPLWPPVSPDPTDPLGHTRCLCWAFPILVGSTGSLKPIWPSFRFFCAGDNARILERGG